MDNVSKSSAWLYKALIGGFTCGEPSDQRFVQYLRTAPRSLRKLKDHLHIDKLVLPIHHFL